MASSSSHPLTTIMTPSQTDLINLTNALSLALDNDVSPSDIQVLRSSATQTDIVVRGKHMSILFEDPTALHALTQNERPDSSHMTRPGSFHGPPNPLGSHPPGSFAERPSRAPATPSTDRDAERRVQFQLTRSQSERENLSHPRFVESEVVSVSATQQVGMSKVEIVKSVVRHVLRKKGKAKVVVS